MHFEKRQPDKTEERILPLINVVFLLLIFFMIAGSLSVTEPFDIQPPLTRSEQSVDIDNWVILLDQQGAFALNNVIIAEPELLQRVRDGLANNSNLMVQLKADGQLEGNRVVKFTQALYAAGVKKLTLIALPEGH